MLDRARDHIATSAAAQDGAADAGIAADGVAVTSETIAEGLDAAVN